MKRLLTYCLFFFTLSAFSQTDYSGFYGFQKKIIYDKRSSVKPNKGDIGRSGSLTLLKIDSTHYKFWLQLVKGWPGYHVGDIDGIVEIKNDTGLFIVNGSWQFENELPCKLKFSLKLKEVRVEQLSSDSECGFGVGVYINDIFPLTKKEIINQTAFLDQYLATGSIYRVTTDKTIIYADSSGLNSKKQFFIKGDKVAGIEESSDFIYIEYLSSKGKFISGWVKKSDLKYQDR